MRLRLIALFSFVFAFGGLRASGNLPWTSWKCGGIAGVGAALGKIIVDEFESNPESNNSASAAEKIMADAGQVVVCGGVLGGITALVFGPRTDKAKFCAGIGAASGAASGGLAFGVLVAVGFGGVYLVDYGKRVYNKFYSNQEPQ